jgi:uncharacterized phiE125 gp8 family phage protein
MLELITPPSREDIFKLCDVERLKAAKRIVHMREDAFLRDCILDSWSYLDGPDGRCRRAVLPQQWALTRSGFGYYGWELPVHGARSIESITYYDSSNSPVTLAADSYWLEDNLGSRRLYFSDAWYGQSVYGRHDAVRIVFNAGWADALEVPRVFRRALLLLAAHYYDNREQTFSDNRVSSVSRSIEYGLDKLLEKYIVPLDYAGGSRAISGRAHVLV